MGTQSMAATLANRKGALGNPDGHIHPLHQLLTSMRSRPYLLPTEACTMPYQVLQNRQKTTLIRASFSLRCEDWNRTIRSFELPVSPLHSRNPSNSSVLGLGSHQRVRQLVTALLADPLRPRAEWEAYLADENDEQQGDLLIKSVAREMLRLLILPDTVKSTALMRRIIWFGQYRFLLASSLRTRLRSWCNRSSSLGPRRSISVSAPC